MRFQLIDRVVEHDAHHVVALKAVTAGEEYLADHFPGFPVLPGVLMLEALVQAARLLVEAQPAGGAGAGESAFQTLAEGEGSAAGTPGSHAPLVLAEVRNVRYGDMVRPGQCLRVEVTLRSRTGHEKPEDGWEFTGTGTVDGQTAVQGRFRLAPVPMAE